jgi:putative nucleotidyltransferase with HDIG domain
MPFFKKTNSRRSRVRKAVTAEQFSHISRLAAADVIGAGLVWLLFVVACIVIISFESIQKSYFRDIGAMAVLVVLTCLAAAFYVHQYQGRIIKNHARLSALAGLFILSLLVAKLGLVLAEQSYWATASAVATAIILSLTYNRRFATGMSIFYCVLAHFAVEAAGGVNLLFTMVAGALVCCFSLREIRTRMKLLEVSALTAAVVFATAAALNSLAHSAIIGQVFYHALAAFIVGVLIQGLLPLIEKTFRIATGMTLLDYSDANQPLLKRLAMEAPGTYSHSLLIGSAAEAAAEAIGRNGLLCRVGAYYHDIGKINKPGYFIENELGSFSRHKELSPAMSQLIIVGHVKDGLELASQHRLPPVLRQFIETHHGTTLVEYFYNEARRHYEEKHGDDLPPPSETEFRYTGPKPRTKEAAIVMLADAVEGATRSLSEPTPTKIEAVVHNIAMKRLQDGQFDECELSLRELSQIEISMAKTLAGHYHGRIAYPKSPDRPDEDETGAETTQ